MEEILVRHDASDYVGMTLAYYRFLPAGKVRVRRLKIGMAFMDVLLVLVLSTFQPLKPPFTYHAIILGLGFLLYVGEIRLFWYRLSRTVRHIIQSAKNLDFFAPTVFRISETGIRRQNEYVETFYSWKVVEGITETEDLILLWVGSLSAFNIPKRGFKLPGDAARFIEYARREWERQRATSDSTKGVATSGIG